jgi:HSP20 family protein
MTEKELSVREKQEAEIASEQTRPRPVFVPTVDIFETDDKLVVMADMPGVSEEGVDIHLEKNELRIRGNAKDTAVGQPAYTEYNVGDYQRSFMLADIIDQEGISAQMKDGVLRIELPKAKAAQPRKIQVSGG